MRIEGKPQNIQIIKIALIFEGFLAFVYLIDAIYRDVFSFSMPRFSEVCFGVLLSQLLFVCNSVIAQFALSNKKSLIYEFLNEMIFPIVGSLTVGSAFLVSLAAGVGEELFFRGFLQPKIGIVATSILFGVVHFLFNIRKYFLIMVLYIMIGFLFGAVYELFDSLWAPVIFHVLYDFSAILYFIRRLKTETVFHPATS